MGTKLKTVSVRLGEQAGARVSKAAHLARQSKGAFLAKAGDEAARNLLLESAGQRHANGEASLSELAAETGMPIEVIEEHVSGQRSAVLTRLREVERERDEAVKLLAELGYAR